MTERLDHWQDYFHFYVETEPGSRDNQPFDPAAYAYTPGAEPQAEDVAYAIYQVLGAVVGAEQQGRIDLPAAFADASQPPYFNPEGYAGILDAALGASETEWSGINIVLMSTEGVASPALTTYRSGNMEGGVTIVIDPQRVDEILLQLAEPVEVGNRTESLYHSSLLATVTDELYHVAEGPFIPDDGAIAFEDGREARNLNSIRASNAYAEAFGYPLRGEELYACAGMILDPFELGDMPGVDVNTWRDIDLSALGINLEDLTPDSLGGLSAALPTDVEREAIAYLSARTTCER